MGGAGEYVKSTVRASGLGGMSPTLVVGGRIASTLPKKIG